MRNVPPHMIRLTYLIETDGSPERLAAKIASDQSTGTFVAVPGETEELKARVAARVAAGHSLLIFPEGTRTAPGVALNPLRPGFALIAARARVPIRLILVRAPRDLVQLLPAPIGKASGYWQWQPQKSLLIRGSTIFNAEINSQCCLRI